MVETRRLQAGAAQVQAGQVEAVQSSARQVDGTGRGQRGLYIGPGHLGFGELLRREVEETHHILRRSITDRCAPERARGEYGFDQPSLHRRHLPRYLRTTALCRPESLAGHAHWARSPASDTARSDIARSTHAALPA